MTALPGIEESSYLGGHKDIVELLLEKGAKPNVMKAADKSKPYSRLSPLHYAVIFGYKDIATLLLCS